MACLRDDRRLALLQTAVVAAADLLPAAAGLVIRKFDDIQAANGRAVRPPEDTWADRAGKDVLPPLGHDVFKMRWPRISYIVSVLVTVVTFVVIFERVPLERLVVALAGAEYGWFLALMITNACIYVAWDTLVLAVAIRWFHGPVRWRDLLPVRSASYVIAVFNTNLGRGALAVFVSRLLGQPFLQIGSTVIFLVLTEYTHLVVWATLGVMLFGVADTQPLLWVPPVVAAFWLVFFAYARVGNLADAQARRGDLGGWLLAPWRGALMRTFRLAPLRRYGQIVLLKAPMFFASLVLHYLAARAFYLPIPFGAMVTFLPVVFMVAALPITVGRLGSTQAAWIVLFGAYAPAERLLAFSFVAHLTFALTRALVGLLLLPRTWQELLRGARTRQATAV